MRLSLNNLLALLALLVLGASALAADDPRATARGLAADVDGVVAELDSGSRTEVRARWDAFNDRWLEVEDPIRALSPELYRRIEERMQDVTGALPRQGEWQVADARTALDDLYKACLAVSEVPETNPRPRPAALGLDAFLDVVRTAHDSARRGAAQSAFAAVNEAWFRVESTVSAMDREAYVVCESALVDGRTAASRKDAPGVAAAIERLRARVEPLARRGGHVGALDAGLILLREGAEALLVLAAIAAFLGRLGAPEKARHVWAGGAVGLLASAVAGGVLAWFFAGVTAGERREVVEGVSSLVAAALLVVVGQWLHEKIRRGGWKKEVQGAVESGRTLSLFLVAFFAVFREGAETVVFLAGIAPASTPRELALGALGGAGALLVLGVALVLLGRRVPVGPFLGVATVLLWALAVKFAGNGVIALQTGGVSPSTRFGLLPEVPALGFAPTVESVAAQLVVVLLWTGLTLAPRWRRGRLSPKQELSSIEA